MIRLYIKDNERKLDREWFKKQWKQTPFMIRHNLYISLAERGDTWVLDFGVPLLEMAESKARKSDENEINSQRVVIENDFTSSVRKELEKEGLGITDIELNIPAPKSKIMRTMGKFFGHK